MLINVHANRLGCEKNYKKTVGEIEKLQYGGTTGNHTALTEDRNSGEEILDDIKEILYELCNII